MSIRRRREQHMFVNFYFYLTFFQILTIYGQLSKLYILDKESFWHREATPDEVQQYLKFSAHNAMMEAAMGSTSEEHVAQDIDCFAGLRGSSDEENYRPPQGHQAQSVAANVGQLFIFYFF